MTIGEYHIYPIYHGDEIAGLKIKVRDEKKLTYFISDELNELYVAKANEDVVAEPSRT